VAIPHIPFSRFERRLFVSCLLRSSNFCSRNFYGTPPPFWVTASAILRYWMSLETIFFAFLGLNYLNSLMRIRDPGWRQNGSRIRDGKKSDPGLRKKLVMTRGSQRDVVYLGWPTVILDMSTNAVLRIRIRKDPKLLAGSDPEPKINVSDPDSDPDSIFGSETFISVPDRIRPKVFWIHPDPQHCPKMRTSPPLPYLGQPRKAPSLCNLLCFFF
jgi:hypothetical protein